METRDKVSPDRYQYTYEDYKHDLARIVVQLKMSYPQTGNSSIAESVSAVIGIANGGLVLATHLSYILQKPLLIYHKDGAIYKAHEFRYSPVLLVDDIYDTGKTIDTATKHLKSYKFEVYRTVTCVSRVAFLKDMLHGLFIEYTDYGYVDFWWEKLPTKQA